MCCRYVHTYMQMCDRAVPSVQLQLSSTVGQTSGTLQTWRSRKQLKHFISFIYTGRYYRLETGKIIL